MTKKDFKQMADIVVEINCKHPFSGELVKLVEKRIEEIVKQQPTFDILKWRRYISTQISKTMVKNKLKEGEKE